jgi:hypothetical protein
MDYFLYPCISGWLFHCVTIVKRAAINTGVQVSLLYIDLYIGLQSSRNTPMNDVVGSYGSSSSSFLRNLHIAFQNGCSSLNSHEGSFPPPAPSPSPHQHSSLPVFLMEATLPGVTWTLGAVLTLLLRMYLLNVCTSSENCLFSSFAQLVIILFVLWLFSFLSSYVTLIP